MATEKRFTLTNKSLYIEIGEDNAIADGEVPCTQRYVCTTLNELHEENEQLKNALKELKEIGDYQEHRIKELYDENEQLKKQIDNMAFILRQNGLGLMEDDD